MPGLRDVVWLVEDYHGQNYLWDDDRNTRGGGDPSIHIGDATGVALGCEKSANIFCKCLGLTCGRRTMIRAGFAGVKIEVQ